MITHVTISGLKATPKRFRWGTIIRILRKYGADRYDINRIHRRLNQGKISHFHDFELK